MGVFFFRYYRDGQRFHSHDIYLKVWDYECVSDISQQAEQMVTLFKQRQNDICTALSSVEPSGFVTDTWERSGGGGGITRVVQGDCIEKGGVNTSQVHGTISESERPMFSQLVAKVDPHFVLDNDSQFFATGISLVLHPKNPWVPTVHANYRYFQVRNGQDQQLWWIGGGADLTPYYLIEDDAQHFHQVHYNVCEAYKPGSYGVFKQACDDYFYLPHRKETRGVGGIFLDYLYPDYQALFQFVSQASSAFIDAYVPIVEARKDMDYTPEQVHWQRLRRGRYAEFNLVYDRGTLFGLKTGGRIESILMSMPPHAIWAYDHAPKPGSPEADLLQVVQSPKEWM